MAEHSGHQCNCSKARLVGYLLDLLREPGTDAVEGDSGARLACHKSILERKRMIREVFGEFHTLLRRLENRYLDGKGIAIELGAGVAPMRDAFSDVLSTDIVHAPHLDFVMDAQAMALATSSV